MDEKQLQALYDAMQKKLGLGTFDQFKSTITSDSNFRKAFYGEASQELELGDYQTFDNSVKKKGIGSLLGGKASANGSPTTNGRLNGGGGENKTALYKPEDISESNRRFEERTGHKELSLGSDLPQIAKAREEKKYLQYKDIEENQINPVLSNVASGIVQPEQLSKLYNTPHGKKIVLDVVNNEVPEAGLMGLDSDVFGNEKKWKGIAEVIQGKNRQQGIDAQNQQESELDIDLINTFANSTYGKDHIAVRGGGEAVSERQQKSFGNVNTKSAAELSEALRSINSSGKVWGREGNELDKKGLAKKIGTRIFQIKSQEDIHQEIVGLSDKIKSAVSKVPVEWKKQGGGDALINKDVEYVADGLNYIRDTDPGRYAMVMGSIDKLGKIGEGDYQELVMLGRDINSFRKFKQGEYIEEDKRSFLTKQGKKALLGGFLYDELNRSGKNKQSFRIPQEDILEVYKNVPEELKDDDLLLDIIKDEVGPAFGFLPIAKGEGIPKKGLGRQILTNTADPFAGILNTIDYSFDSPFNAYLKSKELDRGDNIVINSKGEFTNRADDKFLNKAVGGLFAFLTQVGIARAIGAVTAKGTNALIGSVSPRAATITTSQAALNVGTPISIIAQQYGDEYVDFLEKTGSPTKAALGAFVSTATQGAIERFILPDVKIADKAAALFARKNLAKEIINVIENGGGKAGVGKVIKDFTTNTLGVFGKEAIAEENLQNFANYLTEAVISPKTVQDRSLMQETEDITKASIVQMAIPAILGGAGETKIKRGLSKVQLNHIGVNADVYQQALDNQLVKGLMTQEEHYLSSNIIQLHRNNIVNSPKYDSKGDFISAERQLEYAYQSTVQETLQQQADKQKDKVQREPIEKKIEEAEKIKRQIFNGEEGSSLPSKKGESVVIDQDRDLDTEGGKRENDIILQEANDFAVDITDEVQRKQFQSNPEEGLREAAQQIHGTTGEAETANKFYGKRIADLALEMFPTKESAQKANENTPDEAAPSTGLSRGDEKKEQVPAPPKGGANYGNVFQPAKSSTKTLNEKQQELVNELPKQKVNYKELKGIGDLSVYLNNPESLNSPHLKSAKAIYEDIKNGKPIRDTPSVNENMQVMDGQNRIAAQLAAGIIDIDVAVIDKSFYDKQNKDQSLSSNTPSKEQTTASKVTEPNLPISEKDVNLPTNEGQVQNIAPKEDKGTSNRSQPLSEEKLQERYKRVTDENDLVDPYDVAVKYFADGGKINPSELERIFGGKGDKGARISLMKNGGGTVKQIAHYLWESDASGKYEDTHYIDAVESALRNNFSKSGMQKDIVDRYDYEAAREKYLEQAHGKEAVDIIEKMSDEEINHLLKLDAENHPDREKFIDEILSKSSPEKPSKVTEQPEKVTEEGAGTPPPGEQGGKVEGEDGGKKKSVVNRLYNAKNVPQAAKEYFEKSGLDYKPSSQQEAVQLAKAIVDELGIDEALAQAENINTFDGDVRTFIFTEILDRLQGQENAVKWAEVAITMDKFERSSGRAIAAVGYFYKNNPYGVVLKENADRKKDFDNWSKPKDKSWKEYFEELKKNPEFETIIKEQVKEGMKQERVASRTARIEKVRSIFKKAREDYRKSTKLTVVPPPIFDLATKVMEELYVAGETIADIIKAGVDTITAELKSKDWDTDSFRKEWEDKLAEKGGKKPLTDEEVKIKILDKFRKKLSGLSDKQKEEVIRKAHRKLIENGALEYEDFRDIIGEVTGRGKMTEEQAKEMQKLVEKTNAVGDAAKRLSEERTDAAIENFYKTELEAGKAAKELQDIFQRKPDLVKRLVSIAQLSTLGPASLLSNVTFNVWNQMGLRFPIGVINDLVDRGMAAAAKLAGKNYTKEYNIFAAQTGFFEMLGLGGKESMEQFLTGLNRMDYTQKEIWGQGIRPRRALRDLIAYKQGKKKLTGKQVADKAIQASVGVPAEIIARLLNVGDKPFRFAAEGATASQLSKSLGLTGIDKKLFMIIPREEAYRAYKAQGLSDEVAGQKADYVKEAIVKEGERATFQQDNLLNDLISGLFNLAEQKSSLPKDSGVSAAVKMVAISPYIKIPSNAFWSFYNLLNPEVAAMQSIVHGNRSRLLSNKGEYTKSKLAMREARYWMGHAIVGIATRAVVVSLVQAGLFTPGNNDDDDSKKERDAINYFDKAGTMQIGNMKVSNRWLGPLGMIGNAMSRQRREMAPEQREAQGDFWNIVFSGMELEALKELENGIFANTSSMLQLIDGNPYGASRYLMNITNLMTNIIQPATVSQINKASLDYVPDLRGDNFLDRLNKNFAQRSTLYRRLFKVQLERKVDMWGQPIPKGGNILSRMFGISKANPQIFSRPLYDDYLETGDSGFLPPAVLNNLPGGKLNAKQLLRLETYIGEERKKILEPYINDMAKLKVPDKDETGNLVLIEKLYSEINNNDHKKNLLQNIYSEGRDKGVEKFYKDFQQFKPKEKSVDEKKEGRLMEASKKSIKVKNKTND